MKKVTTLLTGAALLLAAGSVSAYPLNNGPVTIDTSAQYNLQEVVNTVFGTGKIDVQNDQTGVGGWNHAENDTAAFRVIASLPISQVNYNTYVGIYDLVTGQEYQLMNLKTQSASSFSILDGSLYINNNDTLTTGWSGQFGFYSYNDYLSTSAKVYTEDSKNGDTTRAATYLLGNGWTWNASAYSTGQKSGKLDGNNDWLVAMEIDGGFLDFQDATFIVEDMTAVPEPGTIALLGAGLVAVPFIRRRMKS